MKNDLVDYAYPTMMAERCLKRVHDLCLDKRYKDAQDEAKKVVDWLLEIRAALKKMEEDAQA